MTEYTPTIEDDAKGLTRERTREELVALLIEHQHSYDADCQTDSGCSCGWGPASSVDEHDDDAGWQDAAFAEHLASILRDEPQPVVPQHEDIARQEMEEAERRVASRTPEAIAEARSKALLIIGGNEMEGLTATVHPEARVFIEGATITMWRHADEETVSWLATTWLVTLLRDSLDADDPRWATRDDIPGQAVTLRYGSCDEAEA